MYTNHEVIARIEASGKVVKWTSLHGLWMISYGLPMMSYCLSMISNGGFFNAIILFTNDFSHGLSVIHMVNQ